MDIKSNEASDGSTKSSRKSVSIPISTPAGSTFVKIKSSNNIKQNSHSQSYSERRQSILLLSESIQSRKSSIMLDMKNSKRNSGSNFIYNSNSNSGNTGHSLGKSVDSKVFIPINSPNFKSTNQNEIVNSLNEQNYLNLHLRKKSEHSISSSADALCDTAQSSDAIGETDDEFDDLDISEQDPHLSHQGADITRDIYSLAKNSKKHSKLKKARSSDDLSSLLTASRRGSTASALNVPGGFRRHHIIQKVSTKSAENTNDKVLGEDGLPNKKPIEEVPFLTRNFLEFLYIYGHFAGESFEDEIYPVDSAITYDGETDEEDSEITPLMNKQSNTNVKITAKGTTSTFKAFLLMIKSFIGTGVLFLPRAFANGGLSFCVIMLTFFGTYSYWCYYILIKSKVATNVSSFGDIGAKLYGPWMKFVILFSLTVTQIGFSAAYVVFTSTNLMAFFKNVFHYENFFKLEWFLVFQIIVFIPLSFIRNVSKLSLPSLLANFFIMSGLVIVIVFVIKHLVFDLNMKPAEGIVYGFNSSTWSLFIGTAIFAFEGIGLIIPVQDSMKHPEQFPKVLLLVILSACILFILIATLGYLAYGSSIETVILLNLPQTNIFVNLIQFFYSLAILLSTPLQLFPAIAIIENKILKPRFVDQKLVTGKTSWKIKWMKNFIRSLIVVVTVGIAYFGSSDLDRFVSIVGCFACIPLVYMYPPMLHLSSCTRPDFKNNPSWKNRCMVILDYVLIAFGAVSMVYTSYQSIFA